MKIFSSDALHELDQATCKAQNIDSLELMERAANAACYEIVARFLPGQRIIVVAGPGNNGGDALATARLLIERGYRHVEIFLFNIKGHLSHDCEEERNKLITLDNIDFTEVVHDFIPPHLGEDDVVIDGLFGSGLKEAMQGGFVTLAKYINESGAYVISLDIPSGLMGEWNANLLHRDMVHADLTLTFQIPRLSFFFEENADVIGEWKLLDIDLDQKMMKDLKSNYMLVEAKSVRPLLRPRRPFTAKRDYGSALFFAGSTGMMGAAVLCGRSCLKSGAGLAMVHAPHGGLTVMQTAVPEALFEPDRSEHFISDMSIHHKHQAVAAGPGIGTHDQTIDALESLLKNCDAPLLLDADALNCISQRPALLTMLPRNTVITPHIGEFDRLFGEHRSAEERLAKAIEMAKYYTIIIVLKGHYTVTVRPTGKVFFNSTGNPGMATAGAGDVLTGVIAALMAQGFKPEHAATVGVYIHGLAGDIASEELGEMGVTARDISDRIGRAVKMIMDREEIPNPIFAH